MPAQIAACTVNYSMGRPDKPVKATDFMPTQWRKTQDVRVRMRKVDRDLPATQIRGVMAGFMKREKNG